MAVWQPRPGRLGAAARIASALHKARQLASGVHATAGERSWECGTCVSAAVLQADFQALDVEGYCDAAHLRYAEANRVADGAAARQRTHDPRAPEIESELAAGLAPDFMGAAICSGLPAADPWRQRTQQVRNVVLGETRAELGTSDVVFCDVDVNAGLLPCSCRLAASAAVPSHRAHSRAGRSLRPLAHTIPHFSPVQTVLAPDAPPPSYDCATPITARTAAALRSAHVPGDHAGVFAQQCNSGYCVECETAVWGESESITEIERRWRVVQHHLLHCDGGLDAHKRPSVSDLRLDLLDAAENHAACVAAVQSAYAFLDTGGARAPKNIWRMSAECDS